MFKRFLQNNDISKINFRPDIFPTVEDREFWGAFQSDECVAFAEQNLDYGWPPIKATDFMAFKLTGDRKIMENIHYERRKVLTSLAFAELKENKGRFLVQIVNGLFATCEETYWGVSAHFLDYRGIPPYLPSTDPYIDLFAGETAEHLAIIITVLRKPLLDFCPEIIDRVEYELDRRIKTPYEAHNDFWWMANITDKVNNWNPWILSNVLTVYLLTEKNEKRKAKAFTKMFSELQKYYDVIPSDGGCDEGPMYWARAGAMLFELVYQLKISTNGKIDLTTDEKFRKIGSYYKKAHIAADIFVNVADADHIGLGQNIPLAFGYGMVTDNKELMNFCADVWKQRTNKANPLVTDIPTMRRAIFCSSFLTELEKWEISYPIHDAVEILPEMQFATLRAGDMVLSAKGGHNDESHNHNDVGSFTLYENTTPILIDIGRGTYTKDTFDESTRYTKILWTQGAYHNIPIVNGVQQVQGRNYSANSFKANESEVKISFAGAYRSDAGLERLDRTISLNENGVLITDEFVFGGEKQGACETFISILPVEIENGEAIIGGKYKISAPVGAISCEKVLFNDDKMVKIWGTDGVNKITLECQNEIKVAVSITKI